MVFPDDDARYRTAILDAEDEDQDLLSFVRSDCSSLTGHVLHRSPQGRRRRDWALDWLGTTQQCSGHFVLRGAVVHALAQAD